MNYQKRAEIDWESRQGQLGLICDTYRRNDGTNDCIIPVSGGKDSHTLVALMTDVYKMHPLLVTVADPFKHTIAGTHNLNNLKQHYNHYQYEIALDTFQKASRWAFEQLGIPLKFIEVAIYTIPYYLARIMGIHLVIFGENSAYEYGMTEHNFMLGNKFIYTLVKNAIADMDWWKDGGVGAEELGTITPHVYNWPLVLYMSYFYPWSSVTNFEIAKEMGFQDLDDTGEWMRVGTIEQFEQIDSYGYLAHLWLRYPRMGFQRATDIATRRVREGYMTGDEALEVIEMVDHQIDPWALGSFCETLGYTQDEFWHIVQEAPWNKYFGKPFATIQSSEDLGRN